MPHSFPTRPSADSARYAARRQMTVPAAIEEQVRLAARALASAGLVHAFGHCSARLDATSFLVCAPLPMGRIADEPGTAVPIEEWKSGVMGKGVAVSGGLGGLRIILTQKP